MAITRDFEGKLLISASDGRNLGKIKGIFLDETASRGVAVYLGKKGILSRKMLMIDLKHVQLCGVDAWLLRSSDCVVALNEPPVSAAEKLILASEIFGREIQTEGGTKIGTIGDVVFDERFIVLGFSFEKLHIEGPLAQSRKIARKAVTSIGSKDTPAVASLEQAEKLMVQA